MKTGHLSVDPWAVVDAWLGYGEDTDDDVVISHSERNSSLLNGAANPERVTSVNGAAKGNLGGLASDRGIGDEDPPTIPSEPMVEDPMQTKTLIAVLENITPVRDSIEVRHAALESRVDDSPSKQGHGVQTSIGPNIGESLLRGLELQNLQPAVTKGDLVTVNTDIVTSTSVTSLGPVTTSQGNQESTLERKTVVMESVEVTTTTVSTAEQKSSFPKVIVLGSDSDSDGPLPDIVDGDPDSESD